MNKLDNVHWDKPLFIEGFSDYNYEKLIAYLKSIGYTKREDHGDDELYVPDYVGIFINEKTYDDFDDCPFDGIIEPEPEVANNTFTYHEFVETYELRKALK